MGKITSNIQDFFDTGIDTEKSYYKNYILYLRISNSDETYISYIEVAF
jgi:hypothetical protein